MRTKAGDYCTEGECLTLNARVNLSFLSCTYMYLGLSRCHSAWPAIVQHDLICENFSPTLQLQFCWPTSTTQWAMQTRQTTPSHPCTTSSHCSLLETTVQTCTRHCTSCVSCEESRTQFKCLKFFVPVYGYLKYGHHVVSRAHFNVQMKA